MHLILAYVKRKKYRYLYLCKNCGLRYPRMRRINTQKYRCGKCRGHLRLAQTFA